jgi:DNA-directed RNA polymerase subunit RPC12/RpoP
MYFNRYKCPSCGNININIDTDNEVIMCDKCNL